jgi:hypothetical protein
MGISRGRGAAPTNSRRTPVPRQGWRGFFLSSQKKPARFSAWGVKFVASALGFWSGGSGVGGLGLPLGRALERYAPCATKRNPKRCACLGFLQSKPAHRPIGSNGLSILRRRRTQPSPLPSQRRSAHGVAATNKVICWQRNLSLNKERGDLSHKVRRVRNKQKCRGNGPAYAGGVGLGRAAVCETAARGIDSERPGTLPRGT